MNPHPYFPSTALQIGQTFHPCKDCTLNHMNSPVKVHLKTQFGEMTFKDGKHPLSVLITNLKAKTVF